MCVCEKECIVVVRGRFLSLFLSVDFGRSWRKLVRGRG
jgi:hypothetical protein